MKDSELQELKPVYIHEANYSAADVISLIDLAMILVRRKRMIAIVVTFFIALGVIIALLTPKIYTYSTSIETGSQIIDRSIEPFESPYTLLAKLQYSFIPQILKTHYLTKPKDGKKYKIKASVPKNSAIIVLKIKGTEDQANLLIDFLQDAINKTIQDHRRVYDAIKQNFTSSIKQAKGEIAALNPNNNEHAERIQLLKNNIETYKSQLSNLQNTREISPPMKSNEPTGISKKLIIIITAFSGIFLAVFSAFFAEFISKAKAEFISKVKEEEISSGQ